MKRLMGGGREKGDTPPLEKLEAQEERADTY